MAERCPADRVQDSCFGPENDISGPLHASLTESRARTEVTKLVYIGGYGHSGSTLLEYLLAASPEAVACGEVASVLRDRDRKGKCTCRRPIRECPVWGPLFASPDTLDGMSHESLSRALAAQDGTRMPS